MRKIIVCLTIVLLILSLSEYVLRKYNIDFITAIRYLHLGGDWREHQIFTDNDFIPDPYLFWRINPENHLLNSKGFLGDEFSTIKPKDTFRIFCLGDSHTMGTRESSYSNELKDLFENATIANIRFEIINAGVSGYTSLQGLRLCNEIMKYQPDLIIVCFGWNDSTSTKRLADKDFKPGSRYLLSLQRLLYKTHVYRFLRYMYFKYMYRFPKFIGSEKFTYRVSLRDFEENLKNIVRIGEGGRAEVLFITRPCIIGVENKPWMHDFVEGVRLYNALCRELALKLKVHLIDAERILSGHPEYFMDDCHLNKAGNKIFAQQIYSYLKEKFKY